MRALPAILCLLLVACAHQAAPDFSEKGATPNPEISASPPPEAAPVPAPPVAQPSIETVSLQAVNLRQAISSWISEHESADFDLVARMANRFMNKHGFPITVNAAPSLKPGEDSLILRAGGLNFLLQSGNELEVGPDSCGERFLHIPVHLLGGDKAALISGGKPYPFSLRPFHRDQFRVFRGKRLVTEIHAPEPSEPIGISGNGHALLLRFPLVEQLTINWWQRIARQQPALLDEEPYLIIRVSKNRLDFDENIEHLPPQEMEPIEVTEPGHYRWRFMPTGYLLEFISQCSP